MNELYCPNSYAEQTVADFIDHLNGEKTWKPGKQQKPVFGKSFWGDGRGLRQHQNSEKIFYLGAGCDQFLFEKEEYDEGYSDGKGKNELAVIGRKRKWILIGNLMTVT